MGDHASRQRLSALDKGFASAIALFIFQLMPIRARGFGCFYTSCSAAIVRCAC